MDGLRTKFSLRAASVKAPGFLTTGVLAALGNVVTRQSLWRRGLLTLAIHDVAVFTAVGGVLG
jgi:hypothetical protein